MAKRIPNDVIMGFSDTHYPYQHKDTLAFLCAVRDKYSPDRVVCLGDVSDSYTFSHYAKDPRSASAPRELREMRKGVTALAKEFPKVDVMMSNHDDRLYRKAKAAGIPRELVVPYAQFLGVEDYDWNWHADLVLTVNSTREQIYFAHTRTGATLPLAQKIGISACTGHIHTKSGIAYYRGPTKVIWGLDSGCLISDKGHAYAYQKASAVRPVRSVFIIDKGHPRIIPMMTKGKSERWNKEVV